MSTHNGYVKEFPFVRIDSFTSIPNPSTGLHPLYHFLTHAHTDHLVGLSSPAFRGSIFMTPVTKMLVANTMEAAEWVRWEEFGGDRVKRPVRKFENLFKVRAGTNAKAATSAGTGGVGAGAGRGMDQIREINLNQPIKLRGPTDGDWVKVTAVDANHCPGSCMFLFEGVVDGNFRSCLVTGDLRAEPWYLDSLRHNPLLAPYTVRAPTTTESREETLPKDKPVTELDCIYLDTSNVLLDEELVTKEQAIDDLIDLVKQYPDDTKFFLNTWTWGYEDLLKEIHRAFGAESIHLDWYKHRIYTAPSIQNSDPLLAALGTLSTCEEADGTTASRLDPPAASPSLHDCTTSSAPLSANTGSTARRGLRFHACERYWKCDQVWQDGRGCYAWPDEYLALRRTPSERPLAKKLVKPGTGEYLGADGAVKIRVEGESAGDEGRVVYVNPVEMMKWKWEEYRDATAQRIKKAEKVHDSSRKGKRREEKAEWPTSLLVPLARHSTLPELRRFVSIFRPKTLYPLTISTSDPRQPARDYLSMSSLFSKHLSHGGAARLKQEAQDYVKALRHARGVVVTSSPDDDDSSAGEEVIRFGGGAWEAEMRKRGLNIEGGREVFEEVLKWSTVDERPAFETGGVRDLNTEFDTSGANQIATLAGQGCRRLTYGGNLSQQSTSLEHQPTTFSPALLPSALSPPIQLTTPTGGPQILSTSSSIGRTLRKSVTFAPSPTKSPELPVPATTVPMKRTRSLLLPRPSSSDPVRPSPPSPLVPSTSHLAPPADSENAPVRRSPTHDKPKGRKPSKTERERRHERILLALQRTLQGKLGPDGDVIPFTARERETLKRRERRVREESRAEKGRAMEGVEVDDESESPAPKEFTTVGSSY